MSRADFAGAAGFMGSCGGYEEADLVLLGLPMDYTASFRPGSRFGPQSIRSVSEVLETYSPYLRRDLTEKKYYDAGDLELPLGNVAISMSKIYAAADQIFQDDKKPIFMGGEHLVSAALIKAAYKKYPKLKVVHLDAHADLRESYLGEKDSHATVMRQVVDLIGPENLYQMGIRSGTKEEFDFARKYTRLYEGDFTTEDLNEVCAGIKKDPVYITFDIDVVDPAYAPGTGTPEAGGITSKQALEAIWNLTKLNIVGFDLVEVAPTYDKSEITSILAAKLIREMIIAY